jgi:hypothetical protein
MQGVCLASCPCWPRPHEAPFSLLEQEFLAAAVDHEDMDTVGFIGRMDDMATRVGVDRLAYLLSVPIGCQPWVMTAWIRRDTYWTPCMGTALLFAQKMVQYNACHALAYTNQVDVHPCWRSGCSQHPGRVLTEGVSPLRLAVRRERFHCFDILSEGLVRRSKHVQRWDRRQARKCWVLGLVHSCA